MEYHNILQSSLMVDGNIEHIKSFNITDLQDNIPPITTAILTGPQGTNSWYTGSTTIILNALDNPSGVGVASTTYSLDNAPWRSYSTTSPIVVGTEGEHILQYYSTDWFGNQEATGTLRFKIDKTAPEGMVTLDSLTRKLVVIGRDNLSSTTVVTTATSSLITDQAGHTLRILFSEFKGSGGEAKVRVTGLVYDKVTTKLFPISSLKYEWSLGKNSVLKELEQKATITKVSHTEGKYSQEKNSTVIQTESPVKDSEEDRLPDGTRSKKVTLHSLRVLNLSTARGAMTVGW